MSHSNCVTGKYQPSVPLPANNNQQAFDDTTSPRKHQSAIPGTSSNDLFSIIMVLHSCSGSQPSSLALSSNGVS